MRIRTTAAAVLVAAAGTLALGGVAHAQINERDCAEFRTQRQAQAVLDSPAGDPARLDADRDGLACEIWFARRDAAPREADQSPTGPARQVSPVPRGGVDTGLSTARPVRSNPAPPAILLVAAFAVAGTAAAGAAAAARGPDGTRSPVPIGAALLCGLLLTGCGTAASAPSASAGPPPAPAPVSSSLFLPESEPVRVLIPALDVKTRLIELGLRPDGTMEVPASGDLAGWYAGAPTPGELGPAVITAHVSWKGKPGVFADLTKLVLGDQVGVRRADGTMALFEVLRVAQYAKSRLPTEEVYGDIQHAGLRLITCGGDVDPETGDYSDNLVVYAGLVGSV
jgi:Sortase domain/Excalibur calcium-binding domain